MIVAVRIGIVVALGGMLGCSAISGLSGLDFDGGAGGELSASGGRGAGGHGGEAAGGAPASGGSSANGGAPTCTDGKKNGDETDVDCGGHCPPCPLGDACGADGDCETPGCVDGYCQTAPVGVWINRMVHSVATDRDACSMGWDGSKVRLLDGQHASGAISGGRSYLWDGSTWTEVDTAPPSFTSRYQAMYTDLGTGMLIFGGEGMSGPLNDTWTLATGTSTWGLVMATGPSPRQWGAIAAAPGGTAILFGGTTDYSDADGDTWQFDGANWKPLAPMHTPSPRFAAAMAYDPKHGQSVLVGGATSQTDLFTDYWLWTGSDWTKGTATPPPPRYGAAMVYSSLRQRTILFTGAAGLAATPLTDTWEWDGSSWVETATTAPPVNDACAAYDHDRHRVVLYGGSNADGSVASDTWEYHVHGNACQKAADCDTDHCVDHLCCEQASCGMCARCNDPGAPGICTPCSNCDHGKCP